MKFNIPVEINEIISKVKQNGYQIFIVGGAVRDQLLNRDVKDWDFTTNANPEQILEIFPESFNNNQFGTVGIKTSLGVLEITTMRKEGEYKDLRHPDKISWTDDISEDLKRRDFTINAMAANDGEIIDPFNGSSDLDNKLIRAVGNPENRFNEDALRLLRAIRFATQLGFEIEEQTFLAIKKNFKLLEKISWERIRDELFKILESENAYFGILKLKECNLLKLILPEVEDCFGIIQEGPKHDRVYDIGEHLLLSLKFCPSYDPVTKFATLIHDIGKVATYKKGTDGNITFYGHDKVGADLSKKVSERLRLSKKDSEKIYKLIRYHMFTVDENQTDSAVRRFIKNIGVEIIDDMMAVRIGDRLGGGTKSDVSWRMNLFKEKIKKVLEKPFSINDLKVDGNDVMEVLKIKPSRKVGEILDALFKEVENDHTKNNRDYLLEKIKEL